ncbi:MAG: DNA topoisomerase (ATP-hydrolyzing) subunit A [Clostridia bacterium]|nr:DNA topoisomerase (ATP-hydrolyzing) subunit A [Clostridia bacterium]
MTGIIEGAGEVIEQKIDDTLEKNYMPYAMSVIMSRALPEIDGFKPSHRKLLYTMYKMGLLNSSRTKSANIVGQTMKLNPHGDSAIYDTMVRLSRGYEALLHPYIDSKGNFGKFYSRDMAWAASRYTEAKLDKICTELFSDIDKNTVDFVFNYDNTILEPTLLPAKFPSVLVNANTGIAVGMASSVCPFNLGEVCKTAIKLIKHPKADIMSTLIAPDFPGGGNIIYDKEQLQNIYNTGRGSIKVRAEYLYDKDYNCIDILNIPPTTTTEAIIEKVIELVKQNKIREISDIRDETGIDGLKITIDLKRKVDPDTLMLKLFKMTPLEDSFSCNFNILINQTPKVMGVKEIFAHWTSFRINCIKRRTQFDLDKKQNKLHLLLGLKAILLDIDKAINIIRNTDEENMVVPNLMSGFNIDKTQAEFVSEIKLRHLNKEYILKQINEIKNLNLDIDDLTKIVNDDDLVKNIIISELREIIDKYAQPRKSMLLYPEQVKTYQKDLCVDNSPVVVFFTKENYLKKITPQSLRMSNQQKLKDDDSVISKIETTNNSDILFFTNKALVYKAKLSDFAESKASVLGDYVPAKLGFSDNEKAVVAIVTSDYSENLIFFFENGKAAKVPLSSYKTKTNRKKLSNAYCSDYTLVAAFKESESNFYLLSSQLGRLLVCHSDMIPLKQTKNTQGIKVFKLIKSDKLSNVLLHNDETFCLRHKPRSLPSPGFRDDSLQIKFDIN